MLLIKLIAIIGVSCLDLLSASTVSERGPTGLKNRENICYMNALLSCLYDVTPFRKTVYDNFDGRDAMIKALAGVFARKQLNILPSIDLERDMMATVSHLIPQWEFGHFQDIDEFFKQIVPFFPETIANLIGFVGRERLTTDNGDYVINEGREARNPIITVKLPTKKKKKDLDLQSLLNDVLNREEKREYVIHREDHPEYFEKHQIHWSEYERTIEIEMKPIVSGYSNIVPVFIARRTQDTGSNKRDFRTDTIDIPELITLPLDNGHMASFTLVSFAVYHPGHYLAYAKSIPSMEWFVYNDESVSKPSVDAIIHELETNAVLLFYVHQTAHVLNIPIPEKVEKWSITSMIVQHMRNRLVPRIKKLLKKSKK